MRRRDRRVSGYILEQAELLYRGADKTTRVAQATVAEVLLLWQIDWRTIRIVRAEYASSASRLPPFAVLHYLTKAPAVWCRPESDQN